MVCFKQSYKTAVPSAHWVVIFPYCLSNKIGYHGCYPILDWLHLFMCFFVFSWPIVYQERMTKVTPQRICVLIRHFLRMVNPLDIFS